MKARRILPVLFAVFAGFGAGLIWRCDHDPQISFLPVDGRAKWITFPASFDAKAHDSCRIDTVFTREFVLSDPASAKLEVRAAKNLELKINDQAISFLPGQNWKKVQSANVTSLLRMGANAIKARVVNDNGPPLLWLLLKAGQTELRSDETWESSCAGSPMRKVALATRPRLPEPGNPVGQTERSLTSLFAIWRIWLVMAAIGGAGYFGAARWLARPTVTSRPLSGRRVEFLVGLVSALWLALFWNNARLMPYLVGFDAQAHADYISYIQQYRSLPWPNQGYEMFQPPLYYVLSAAVFVATGVSVEDESGIILLRLIATIFAITNVWLVFLTLRLLFPNQAAKQVIGVLCAAFLPMQLYLSHFVTNEMLAATLMTAVLFLSLRMLRTDDFSLSQFGSLGVLLGLALLTKSTAVLLIPSVLLACALRPCPVRHSHLIRLRDTLATLVVCFIVCGWYYLRIWSRFGRPLVGNWQSDIGFNWWQDPGFHTASDYLRFGRSLDAPFFSSLNGFPDGIYSTLWGDGLLSGTTTLDLRLPWNYDLMAAGYWLALVPALLMTVGACIAVRNAFRARSAIWLLLLSYCAAIMLAFFYITAVVPSYAQLKAFYGLSLLVPLSGFTALGWEALTRHRKWLQVCFGVLLLVFAFNSIGAIWIRASPEQHLYAGLRLFLAQKAQPALAEAEKATESGEMKGHTRAVLALLLNELDRPLKALEQAKRSIAVNPSCGISHLQLARIFGNQGELEEAIEEARTAADLAPEDSAARQELANLLLQTGSTERACLVAKEGVAVAPFDPDLHYTFGLAAARKGDFATAANQFAYSLLLRKSWPEARSNLSRSITLMTQAPNGAAELEEVVRTIPDSPEELNDIAWILATHPNENLRNGTAALELAKHGCEIANYQIPRLLLTFAAACAETNRFDEAISSAEKALGQSRVTHDAEVADLTEELLGFFSQGRPFRSVPANP